MTSLKMKNFHSYINTTQTSIWLLIVQGIRIKCKMVWNTRVSEPSLVFKFLRKRVFMSIFNQNKCLRISCRNCEFINGGVWRLWDFRLNWCRYKAPIKHLPTIYHNVPICATKLTYWLNSTWGPSSTIPPAIIYASFGTQELEV